jgi:glycosyltransferase involved in cell wall biosynthesis
VAVGFRQRNTAIVETGMRGEHRVAIVHDSLTQHAEAECIVEEIARMLPQADLLLAVDAEPKLSHYIRSRSLKTTWMNYFPAKERLSRSYRTLPQFGVRGLDLSDYSIVISSCLGFARRVVCPDEAIHVCYCHTATPAQWRNSDFAHAGERNNAAEGLMEALLAGIGNMGAESSLQPDYYIAKSRAGADEIKRRYGRKSLVIHPPIDISRYHPAQTPEDYYLVVSPLLPHRRIDMTIAACNSTGKRLLIVGEGPDRSRLERLAGPTVELLGKRTQDETSELLSHCHALFCFGAKEDFDAMPLKANASGRPAISFAAGSALETIADGESGVLYREESRPAIVDAMRRCSALDWDAGALRTYSRGFDVPAFRSKFATMLEDILGTTTLRRAIV